jgi:hypothetical protein
LTDINRFERLDMTFYPASASFLQYFLTLSLERMLPNCLM